MAITGVLLQMDGTKILPNTKGPNRKQSYMNISSKACGSALQQGSKRLLTTVYKNAKLFQVINKTAPRGVAPHRAQESGTETPVGSVVMAGRFEKSMIKDIAGAVELNFVTEVRNNREPPLCVFWDFDQNGMCSL